MNFLVFLFFVFPSPDLPNIRMNLSSLKKLNAEIRLRYFNTDRVHFAELWNMARTAGNRCHLGNPVMGVSLLLGGAI